MLASRLTSCSLAAMTNDDENRFVDRVSRQGEEALGRIAEELIASPLVSGAVSRAFEAREKAVQAQEAALGALNIPSAADVERVTRRLRSVSQRLESIEDTLDRLEERLTARAAESAPKSAARPKPAKRTAKPASKRTAKPAGAKKS
jgi:chromosome segregation ATPase